MHRRIVSLQGYKESLDQQFFLIEQIYRELAQIEKINSLLRIQKLKQLKKTMNEDACEWLQKVVLESTKLHKQLKASNK